MKTSSFSYYDLDAADRKVFSVSSFAGVDYSTQKFNVSDNRAIDLMNYVYKDNSIQKRNGIELLYKVEPYKYIVQPFNELSSNIGIMPLDSNVYPVKTNEVNFNNIWKFTAEDNQVHIIAHIGKLLYEIKNIDNENIEILPIVVNKSQKYAGEDGGYYYRCYEFENYKSSAFVGGNKLWFLGGNKYMCLRYLPDGSMQFYPVDNSQLTPIPTTTISITYKNARVSGRLSLDKVNLLTKWRKNKLISGLTKVEDDNNKIPYFDYTLDSPLIWENEAKDMANFSMTIEERGTIK